jgi:hypothetical protein
VAPAFFSCRGASMASLWPLASGGAASVSKKFLFCRGEPAKKLPELPELPKAGGAGPGCGWADQDA